MALTYEFLVARAEQAAQEASGASLENVRDRALRSEAAWRTMANQVLKAAHERERALQAKAALALHAPD